MSTWRGIRHAYALIYAAFSLPRPFVFEALTEEARDDVRVRIALPLCYTDRCCRLRRARCRLLVCVMSAIPPRAKILRAICRDAAAWRTAQRWSAYDFRPPPPAHAHDIRRRVHAAPRKMSVRSALLQHALRALAKRRVAARRFSPAQCRKIARVALRARVRRGALRR